MKHLHQYFLLIFIGLLFIGYLLYTSLYLVPTQRQKLLQYGKYSIATITDFERIVKRSYIFDEFRPVYSFAYKGNSYIGRGYGIIQRNSKYKVQENDIGSRYLVVFDPEDPTVNSLLPYEKITDTIPDFFITNDRGQVELIHPNFQKEEAPVEGWTKFEKFGSNGVPHVEFDIKNYGR